MTNHLWHFTYLLDSSQYIYFAWESSEVFNGLILFSNYNHSMCCIRYELFVGQPPFYTNSVYALVRHIIKVCFVVVLFGHVIVSLMLVNISFLNDEYYASGSGKISRQHEFKLPKFSKGLT